MTASEMAKRRSEKLSPQRRREIAKSGGLARSDKMRQAAHQRRLWSAIIEAVDTLFARVKKDGKPRAIFVHLGEVVVLTTDSKDYRILAGKAPNSLAGIFNHRSSRKQVFDDIHAVIELLAQAAKS